jgi:hypothetical protein
VRSRRLYTEITNESLCGCLGLDRRKQTPYPLGVLFVASEAWASCLAISPFHPESHKAYGNGGPPYVLVVSPPPAHPTACELASIV